MAQAVSPPRGPAMSAINLTARIYQDSNTLASSNAMSSRCSYLDKSLASEALHQAPFLWQGNLGASEVLCLEVETSAQRKTGLWAETSPLLSAEGHLAQDGVNKN